MGVYAKASRGVGRFLEHLDSITPDANGCLIWPKSKTPRGYGQASAFGGIWPAHRVSAHLFLGLNLHDENLCALHRCDVRACVNPDHLFVGTKGENAVDRDSKGRTAKGNDLPHAKLSESSVLDIRRRLEAGDTVTSVANTHGVTRAAIRRVRDGSSWRHV